MEPQVFHCPSCNAKLDIPAELNACHCPHCGCYISSENGKWTCAPAKQPADVMPWDYKSLMRKKRSKTTLIWSIAVVIIALAFLLNSVISRLGGKVSAGSYKELIGKDYRAVETHFQSAGFTNIQLIDLNDSKTGYLDEGKVDTVSVGGNTSFNVIHWFEPDTPVTISYR